MFSLLHPFKKELVIYSGKLDLLICYSFNHIMQIQVDMFLYAPVYERLRLEWTGELNKELYNIKFK